MILNIDLPKFFPTHKLKDEVAERIKKDFPYKKFKKSRKPKIPKSFQDIVKYYYSIGNWKSASEIIETFDPEYRTERRMEISGNFLGTHSQLLLSNPKIKDKVIIIDEDIDILKIEKHSQRDIVKFIEYLKRKRFTDYVVCIERVLSQGQTDLELRLDKPFNIMYQNFCKIYKPKSDLKELFQAEYLYSDKTSENILYTGRKLDFPRDKTIIILSATPAKFFLQKLYGERIVLHDFTPVKYKGNLYQNTNKSFSRSQLNKSKIDYDGLKKWCKENDVAVISFMDKMSKLTDDECLYLCNTRGYDILNGKYILVLGTHRAPEQQVKIIAKLLDINFDSKAKRKNIKINLNNKQLTFNTFDNPSLKKIDLYLTEKEMEQAVGRARLLWNDTEVFVLSNYPLKQSQIIFNQ